MLGNGDPDDCFSMIHLAGDDMATWNLRESECEYSSGYWKDSVKGTKSSLKNSCNDAVIYHKRQNGSDYSVLFT
jgi:hypothetical protein